MSKSYFVFVLFVIITFSCSEKRNEEEKVIPNQPEKQVAVPNFNADSAYTFIAQQVAFGPRVPNTPAHQQCGDFLIDRLKSYGAQVEVQAFDATAYDGKILHLRNIIASYNPEARKRILLAAHWDTRPVADRDTVNINQPIDGANDGGSGVGVILEIARQINLNTTPEAGVDLNIV